MPNCLHCQKPLRIPNTADNLLRSFHKKCLAALDQPAKQCCSYCNKPLRDSSCDGYHRKCYDHIHRKEIERRKIIARYGEEAVRDIDKTFDNPDSIWAVSDVWAPLVFNNVV